MPVVLVPFVALTVALLALILAYACVVIVTPILEGMAKKVPVIGAHIARGIDAAVSYTAGRLVAWANAGVKMVGGWLHGLAATWRDYVDAVNAFIVALPDQLAHLLNVSVHDVVKAFLAPVHAAIGALQDGVDALDRRIDALFGKPLSDFRGIEHGVELRVSHLADVLRNVDLPDLFSTVESDVAAAREYAGALVGDLAAGVADETAALWDQLQRIPLQQLLDMLTAFGVTAALVEVIALEGGLGKAECRAKVKGICSTDPGAWQALLDVAGLALAWAGIEELLQLTQEFAREAVPAMAVVLRGG